MPTTEPVESDPAPRPKRRTFTSEYKLRIVAEYDAAPRNEKGAVLRRERLYHSHGQRVAGRPGCRGPGKPGRPPGQPGPHQEVRRGGGERDAAPAGRAAP
jgi:hypothetical protein